MSPLAACLLLAARDDRSVWPIEAEAEGVGDIWVPALAAAASLSGMLDDARTNQDVDDAIEHFRALLSCGVLTQDAWSQEIRDTIAAVEALAMMEPAEQDAADAALMAEIDDQDGAVAAKDDEARRELGMPPRPPRTPPRRRDRR